MEVVLFIAIMGVCMSGMMMILSWSASRTSEGFLQKQATSLAESMLYEVQLHDFSNPTGGFTGAATLANRPLFDDVMDYNGFSETADLVSGLSELSGYTIAITVTNSALDNVPSTDAYVIHVDVTDFVGRSFRASGYRTNH